MRHRTAPAVVRVLSQATVGGKVCPATSYKVTRQRMFLRNNDVENAYRCTERPLGRRHGVDTV